MKCPYQTEVVHKPERTTNNYITYYAKDITQFGDCLKEKCPFYHYRINSDASRTERCLRAESEVRNE